MMTKANMRPALKVLTFVVVATTLALVPVAIEALDTYYAEFDQPTEDFQCVGNECENIVSETGVRRELAGRAPPPPPPRKPPPPPRRKRRAPPPPRRRRRPPPPKPKSPPPKPKSPPPKPKSPPPKPKSPPPKPKSPPPKPKSPPPKPKSPPPKPKSPPPPVKPPPPPAKSPPPPPIVLKSPPPPPVVLKSPPPPVVLMSPPPPPIVLKSPPPPPVILKSPPPPPVVLKSPPPPVVLMSPPPPPIVLKSPPPPPVILKSPPPPPVVLKSPPPPVVLMSPPPPPIVLKSPPPPPVVLSSPPPPPVVLSSPPPPPIVLKSPPPPPAVWSSPPPPPIVLMSPPPPPPVVLSSPPPQPPSPYPTTSLCPVPGTAVYPPQSLARWDKHYMNNWTPRDPPGGLTVSDDQTHVELKISTKNQIFGGFLSQKRFIYGYYSIWMKLIPNYSAGIIMAYYFTSPENHTLLDANNVSLDTHDELDFEFLGNVSGQPIVLQTNLHMDGTGRREIRHSLPFDPTAAFHKYSLLWNQDIIIWSVDDSVIRVHHNRPDVRFPTWRPMAVITSLWNGSSWATRGGKDKLDLAYAPFILQFEGMDGVDGCEVCPSNKFRDPSPDCPMAPDSSNIAHCSSGHWWNDVKALSATQWDQLQCHQQNYVIYHYCYDKNRFTNKTTNVVTMPPECKHNELNYNYP